MPFKSSNDLLYTIRPLVLVLRCYGIYLADANELSQRKLSKCKRFCQSLPPLLIIILMLAWTYHTINIMMKIQIEEVALSFYVVIVAMSITTTVVMAIFILKRKSIELMVAEMQSAFQNLDGFVFSVQIRRATVLYAIFPLTMMTLFFCYILVQIATDFKNEQLMYSFLSALTYDQAPNNQTDHFHQRVQTNVVVSMMLVWGMGSCLSICHSIGFVIVIIINIARYFYYYANFLFVDKGATDGRVGAIETPWLVKSKGRFSEENILRCIDRHSAGCQMVKIANEALKELCFALSAVEVLVIIFTFRGMNLKNPAAGLGVKVVIPNIITYFTFITRVVVAARVNKIVMSSLKIMLKIEPKRGSECPSPKVAKWIKNYVKHVRMDPPSLTGWGLYRIREACILTVSGHILTYTLTLYGIGG
ncbi:hypothetical protein CHUAL_011459 [Chamberlinius hualienensis]